MRSLRVSRLLKNSSRVTRPTVSILKAASSVCSCQNASEEDTSTCQTRTATTHEVLIKIYPPDYYQLNVCVKNSKGTWRRALQGILAELHLQTDL
jgi:hypothetical protein